MRGLWRASDVLLLLVFIILSALVAYESRKPGRVSSLADRSITSHSQYPIAVDASLVGTYPADTHSGAGYFYDDVLEYRVWLHPERGAAREDGDEDYYYAFAEYERAEAFSKSRTGAEKPLVLVRQREWINEPNPGEYHAERGERITEWQVKWLEGSKRGPTSIADFLAHPRPARTEPDDGDD